MRSFLLTLLVASAVAQQCVNQKKIDFEQFRHGNYVRNLGDGIHVSAWSLTGYTWRGPRIFDTSKRYTRDRDLERNVGKGLIIQQSFWTSPDDHIFGGSMTFTFAQPVNIVSAKFLDTEIATTIDINGRWITGPFTRNGRTGTAQINAENVYKMVIVFPGTGALLDFVLCEDTPTANPTLVPTANPTFVPTASPTNVPTSEPSAEPTPGPTPGPTMEPTPEPTPGPTLVPTSEPSVAPTPEPTVEPSIAPTPEPTSEPTPEPTLAPIVPTLSPVIDTAPPFVAKICIDTDDDTGIDEKCTSDAPVCVLEDMETNPGPGKTGIGCVPVCTDRAGSGPDKRCSDDEPICLEGEQCVFCFNDNTSPSSGIDTGCSAANPVCKLGNDEPGDRAPGDRCVSSS